MSAVTATPPASPAAPASNNNADWNVRYQTEGHIWGDEPSLTAKRLADRLRPVSNTLEVGCGYGRDMVHLVNRGHRVHGVENAVAGLTEATKQLQDKINAGSAHLLLGEFARAGIHGGLQTMSGAFPCGKRSAKITSTDLSLSGM